MTFRKKFENFWYYYKIHTIVAVLAIFVLAVLIKQCAERVEPDLTMFIVTKNVQLTQGEVQSIQDILQSDTEDVNHDGRKVAYCDVYNLTQGQDAQMVAALTSKLVAELSTSNNAIFVTDDAEYSQLTENTGLFDKLSKVVSGAPNNERIKMSALPDFKKVMSSDADQLSLSIRTYEGTTLEKKNNKPYYDNAVKVLDKLFKNAG